MVSCRYVRLIGGDRLDWIGLDWGYICNIIQEFGGEKTREREGKKKNVRPAFFLFFLSFFPLWPSDFGVLGCGFLFGLRWWRRR